MKDKTVVSREKKKALMYWEKCHIVAEAMQNAIDPERTLFCQGIPEVVSMRFFKAADDAFRALEKNGYKIIKR
jgi:hypothetical protein